MNHLKKEQSKSEDISLKLQSRVCIKNSAVKSSLCFILKVYSADTTSVFRLKYAMFMFSLSGFHKLLCYVHTPSSPRPPTINDNIAIASTHLLQSTPHSVDHLTSLANE